MNRSSNSRTKRYVSNDNALSVQEHKDIDDDGRYRIYAGKKRKMIRVLNRTISQQNFAASEIT